MNEDLTMLGPAAAVMIVSQQKAAGKPVSDGEIRFFIAAWIFGPLLLPFLPFIYWSHKRKEKRLRIERETLYVPQEWTR